MTKKQASTYPLTSLLFPCLNFTSVSKIGVPKSMRMRFASHKFVRY